MNVWQNECITDNERKSKRRTKGCLLLNMTINEDLLNWVSKEELICAEIIGSASDPWNVEAMRANVQKWFFLVEAEMPGRGWSQTQLMARIFLLKKVICGNLITIDLCQVLFRKTMNWF